MTIKEANKELKQKQTELDYWLNKKALIIESTLPKATNYSEEKQKSSTRVDKYKKLDFAIDEIDPIIDRIQEEIKILEHYIEESLKIVGEYEPLERKIIMLRSEYNMKWQDIAIAVNYSERQCQRIYDKYYKRTRKTRNNL